MDWHGQGEAPRRESPLFPTGLENVSQAYPPPRRYRQRSGVLMQMMVSCPKMFH